MFLYQKSSLWITSFPARLIYNHNEAFALLFSLREHVHWVLRAPVPEPAWVCEWLIQCFMPEQIGREAKNQKKKPIKNKNLIGAAEGAAFFSELELVWVVSDTPLNAVEQRQGTVESRACSLISPKAILRLGAIDWRPDDRIPSPIWTTRKINLHRGKPL